jgi:hypothetical protein
MIRPILSLLIVCVAALSFGGCASWTRRPGPAYTYRARTIALAITVDGVLQPTPQQYAVIQAQAVKEFGALGYTIVTDLTLAEQILRVNFIPNANDPENSGRATVLGFRSNPYYASARNTATTGYPTSFGYAGSFSNTNWSQLNSFGYGYYGYNNSYYDGYTYSSPTLNPVRPTVPVVTTKHVHPPYRHDSARCPPEHHRVPPAPPTIASTFTPVTRNDPTPVYASSGRSSGWWRGGDEARSSSASGTSGGGSSSNGTYASSWRRGDSASGDSGSRGNWRSERSSSGDSGNSDRSSWRERTSSNDSGSSRGSWSSQSSSDRGSWRSDPSYSRSDSSSHSRSDSSSYSRSDSHSYHRSEPSSSSSSYSGGSSSSSSGSSHSAPSEPSSSSSGSSGGGSSSTTETVSSRQQN